MSTMPAYSRCLLNVSFVTALVKMSAGFSKPRILATSIIPVVTSCCMYRNLSSICLAFFDCPSLDARLLPVVLSVSCFICTLVVSLLFIRKLLIASDSLVPDPTAYSSASPEDSATVA